MGLQNLLEKIYTPHQLQFQTIAITNTNKTAGANPMTPTPTASDETKELELIVGHTYVAKRSAQIGGFINDRMITYIGELGVQYDSPSVAFGRSLPIVTHEAFRKWAAKDITEQMPKDEWRSAI